MRPVRRFYRRGAHHTFRYNEKYERGQKGGIGPLAAPCAHCGKWHRFPRNNYLSPSHAGERSNLTYHESYPESYATAWTCLIRNLEFKKGQTLVIRGATSALGRAALNIAHDVGATVIATTRKQQRFDALKELGATRCEIEWPDLSKHLPESGEIDAVLDLVGNTTFMDSLKIPRRGGRMCLAGWLGGLAAVDGFNPLLQMPSGVVFTFFGSFVFGSPQFPVSDVPMQEIVNKAAAGVFKAKPARVFKFDDIRDAHEAMESNQSNGKMVVLM